MRLKIANFIKQQTRLRLMIQIGAEMALLNIYALAVELYSDPKKNRQVRAQALEYL